ncbi:MAG: bifunctional GTP diphosphokinase/guanosine-3',5'-bis pyrophosphate 3'-pyrophosphohydrolase [Gammaproteobacteria bacterium]
MVQIDDLCSRTQSYLTPDQVELVRRAYRFGADAHEGQKRRSGEPYIQHPLEVANILAGMHMDHETLAAAMLHDVIEDTHTPKEDISHSFGADVADIVDGVSKLTLMELESFADAQARNIQKMLMAMANDIRVILVKLADRLHNMRTIGALQAEKRRRIARETLEIYAPIAQRLGMNGIRHELEELGFASLYPMRHRIISAEVRKQRGNRKEIVDKLQTSITRRLQEERIDAEVYGREKHVYSIYKKMRTKHLSFKEVFDVYAFRVIVDSVDTCYRVLGIVHNLYKPVPGKFKDYIAIPKANGYQSLHTVLFSPHGVPLEVQIRTRDMNGVAEVGIAAHWLYKTGDPGASKTAQQRAREWLRGLLELQRQAGDSQEFLEHVKTDLFPDEVYVFTPRGQILELPANSTAVDFAYAVHTDVGNHCIAARVDRRLVPLGTRLRTGQTVEIVTGHGARPNPAWLNFVVTGKARANIRHFLKNMQRDEARALGRRMLNRELEQFSLQLETIAPDDIRRAALELKAESIDLLLEDIGLGKRLAPIVARPLVAHCHGAVEPRRAAGTAPLLIQGTEGMVVSFPKCCHPIPGDPIVGWLSSGRGLVIHHQSCRNVVDFRDQPEKLVDVQWAKDIKTDFSAEVKLEVLNQRGALASIAAVIADEGANIENLQMAEPDDRLVEFTFIITVRDRVHLARLIRRLRSVKHVARVLRTKG